MGRSVEEGSSDGESEAKCIPVRQPDEDDSHPSRSIRVARTMVDGVATDFLIQSFSDRIFVIVSQLNKLGTIISVGRDVALGGGETFAVDTLIGRRDEPMLELCARRVAGSMANGGCTKALLMGIGLRQHTRESLKAMIDTIEENKVW